MLLGRKTTTNAVRGGETWWTLLMGSVPVYTIWMVGWLLEIYVLTTSKVISRRVSTWDSVCLWWLYSTAPLGNLTTSALTQYHLNYPDTELTSCCLILLMPSARLGSSKYQLYNSLTWLHQDLPHVRPALHRIGHYAPFKCRKPSVKRTCLNRGVIEREGGWYLCRHTGCLTSH